MKRDSFLMKIWNVLWPVAIYFFVQSAVTVLLLNVLKENYEQYALVALLAAALICIPIYAQMYRNDCCLNFDAKKNIPMNNKDAVAIMLTSAALAFALNQIIAITPLPRIFSRYEETNRVIYGGAMILRVLTAGVFACIVEELSMRGIVYHRMKRYWGKKRALFFSALVFGIYHMNVVQGVYAFFLGLFFCWLYERYNTLLAPIVAHMSANLFVLFLADSLIVEKILNTWVGFCLATCVAVLVFYYGWKWMVQTNPLVELEFVEKEPDTLKNLAQEYKKKEEDHK